MRNFIFISAIVLAGCSSSKNSVNIDASVKGISAPLCIKNLIMKFKGEPRQNPPRSIYSYTYKGNTVYYVSAICCDQYSDLYNGDCRLLGHPDGGLTGKGDGKLPDFMATKKDEKLIWHDERE